MPSRYLEMVEAEKQRLGFNWSDIISPSSPPLIRAGTLAVLLLELETGTMHGRITPSFAVSFQEQLKFVLLACGAMDLLKSPEFSQALQALRADYEEQFRGASNA